MCAARSGPIERPQAEQRKFLGPWHSRSAADALIADKYTAQESRSEFSKFLSKSRSEFSKKPLKSRSEFSKILVKSRSEFGVICNAFRFRWEVVYDLL